MGCDPLTREALGLATVGAAFPTRGTHVTLFCAAPGETQVLVRRAADGAGAVGALRRVVTVTLGSATWFNEPVLRALLALAPAVEALRASGAAWRCDEPPLQVVCVTDGLDNCSPPAVATLPGLVRALRNVSGPRGGGLLYEPMAGVPRRGAAVPGGRVPVWLLWVALGGGGRQLLEAAPVPSEVREQGEAQHNNR